MLYWRNATAVRRELCVSQVRPRPTSHDVLRVPLPDPDSCSLPVRQVSGDVAAGAILARPDGDVALLLTHDLPPLPANSRYQLWLLADGAPPVSGGLFTVDAAGSGHLLVHAPTALSAYATVGVTAEPWAGSPAPTSPVLLNGPLG